MKRFRHDLRMSLRAENCRGFTMIELMVSLLLGLIVIASVGSVFIGNLRSYHSNTALEQVQSGARIAYELMARDIRQAGVTGCGSSAPTVFGASKWWNNWDNAVRGYQDANSAVATAGSSADEGERVPGTNSLTLLGSEGAGYTVSSYSQPDVTLQSSPDGINKGDPVLLCDPSHAALLLVNKNVTGKVVTYDNSKGTPAPAFEQNALLTRLAAHVWYIGYNAEGGKSLYREVYTGGKVSKQEMVRGVTNMNIRYHQNGMANYGTASSITNWSGVNAVRVTFTVVSTNKRAGSDNKPITRKFTSTTAIRSRV